MVTADGHAVDAETESGWPQMQASHPRPEAWRLRICLFLAATGHPAHDVKGPQQGKVGSARLVRTASSSLTRASSLVTRQRRSRHHVWSFQGLPSTFFTWLS